MKLNQQNELEQVLEIFSQDNVIDDLHRLEFEPSRKNPLVEKMARRLARAAADEQIRRQMDAEDSIERMISRELDEKLREKEEELAKKDEELAKNAEELAKNAEELAKKENELSEKDKAIEALRQALEEMKKQSKNI